MKILKLMTLAICLGSNMLHSQLYSVPSGFVTQELKVGINLIGITLHSPAVAVGSFETVTATQLTDNQASYAPIAGKTYILELTTGTMAGTIFEVPAASISGNVITITTSPATDLVTAGVTQGVKYKLRVAPTLEDIFTTVPLANGGVLRASANTTSADIVWVPTGANSYNKYFLRSGTIPFFRLVGNSTPTPNVPLIYADGIIVEKRSTDAASLTVLGEIKTGGTKSVIQNGFNLLSSVAPTGLNLANSGIAASMRASANVTVADILWIQQPNLSYMKYYRRASAWRNTSATNVELTTEQAEAISLSNGFFIERRDPLPATLNMNVPTTFTNY